MHTHVIISFDKKDQYLNLKSQVLHEADSRKAQCCIGRKASRVRADARDLYGGFRSGSVNMKIDLKELCGIIYGAESSRFYMFHQLRPNLKSELNQWKFLSLVSS